MGSSAFSAWLAVAIMVAVVAGRPLEPDLTARSERYVRAITLFLVVAACRPGLPDVRILALVMSAALIVRQVWLTELWLNEQNLAMLAAITTPLVVGVSFCRPLSVLQIPLAAGAAYMTAMVVFVQNRGALVGLGASFLGLWAMGGEETLVRRARHPFDVCNRLGGTAGLLNRFLEIYADGQFVGRRRKDLTSGRVASDSLWIIGCSGSAPATSCISWRGTWPTVT